MLLILKIKLPSPLSSSKDADLNLTRVLYGGKPTWVMVIILAGGSVDCCCWFCCTDAIWADFV